MKEHFQGKDNWYQIGYRDCYYSGWLGVIYGFVHRAMEKPYDLRSDLLRIVEVGSGSGQHLQYVKQIYSHYLMTDIDIDLLTASTLNRSKVNIMQADASNLNEICDSSFDRLVATCLLAHLSNPMEALVEWRRIVRSGGSIVIYVPPEPGLLVRWVRRLFIHPKQRRLGVSNPELLCYSQHKNHYPAMRIMIETVFSEDEIKVKRYPLYLTWHLILFEVWYIELRKQNS